MQTIALDSPEETPSRAASSARRGVLLINLGTPDEPDVPSVRRYLAEFLSDPAVIRLPHGLGWLNGWLGRSIAYLRAPASARAYRKIWTERGSPLGVITQDQAEALQATMPPGWRVFHAMRYGSPSIARTLKEIKEAGIKELVLLSMYPQHSGPTTGTAHREVCECLLDAGHQFELTTRFVWYDDHSYISAQAALIASYAKSSGLTPENCHLLFSTHGLPMSYVKRGDRYPEQVARTVALVGDRLGWPADRMSLAYQSRFGPVEWLRPATDQVLTDLARAGEKKILVCPISFTADCLETLEEIDLRYRAEVEEAGSDLFLCPALNTFPPFIAALKHLVLQGSTPMTHAAPSARAAKSVAASGGNDDIDSLMMVGVSAAGRLGRGRGPDISHVEGDALRKIKRSQREIPALLRQIRADSQLEEAFLWNTCHRFELYGWGGDEIDIAAIKRHLFGDDKPSDLSVNVLRGRKALHHLLRTAMGLHSDLPGERDVLDQLRAAQRLAACGGTAGSRTTRLLSEVTALDAELRNHTAWGAYDLDYCTAAFSRFADTGEVDFRKGRVVVLGGSTTSAAALRTLRNRYDVPSSQLTILYRGHKHGGQVKLLRQAIGGGLRLRVESYDEPRVRRIISDADLLIFGLDRKEPIITADQLRDVRDWESRPLTILDFNMFGSTVGLEDINGITVYDARRLQAEVETVASDICEQENFAEAVKTVESKLAEYVVRTVVDTPNTSHTARASSAMSGSDMPGRKSYTGAMTALAEGERVR